MRGWLAAALVLLALPATASAAPTLVPVGTFEQPVHVAAPPGDAARLFVVERAGRVQVLVNGQKAATAGCSRSRSRTTTRRAGCSMSSTPTSTAI